MIKYIIRLNNNLAQRPDFIIDPTTGKITGYTTQEGGADAVFPFCSDAAFYRASYGGYGSAYLPMSEYVDENSLCTASGNSIVASKSCTVYIAGYTTRSTVNFYVNGSNVLTCRTGSSCFGTFAIQKGQSATAYYNSDGNYYETACFGLYFKADE